jgi:hypothetical protein
MQKYHITRRDLLQGSAVVAAAAAFCSVGEAATKASSTTKLPTIKLGKLSVSRLILGSNPFFGFSHQSQELDEEMRRYHTSERIKMVLDQAADHGITAVAAPPYEHWIKLFQEYIKSGGKLRIWIAQPDPPPEQMKDAIAAAAKGGAKAIFIQGARVDEQFESANRLKLIGEWLEYIKSFGLPAGMASHRPDVHLEAEKAGLPTDFYFQCFFRPDTYKLEDREKAVETIRQIKKPVVGYKILAAGRIPPAEGFEYALSHLRPKDGVCVGMYLKQKPDMIAENASLVARLSKQAR